MNLKRKKEPKNLKIKEIQKKQRKNQGIGKERNDQ